MGKYYWLKLKRDFFKRHDIRILKAHGAEYVVAYLALMCESIDHNGRLRFSEDVPYTPDMLAVVTDTLPDDMAKALELYMSLGLIYLDDDGTYVIPDIDKMTGSAADSDGAERQRRYRERQKESVTPSQNVTRDVTKCNAPVTRGVTKRNESIENRVRDKNKDIYINIRDLAEGVIAYLNERLGTHYQAKSKKTLSLIHARHDEGYTLDDFKKVIDTKVTDWRNDEKMCKYLTPDTLFGTKFEKYLNQRAVRRIARDADYDYDELQKMLEGK